MPHIRLSFSEFHPFDHRLGAPRCWNLPGGPRRHLHLAWLFAGRDQVLGPFKRALACPAGRHTWSVWMSNTGLVKPVCRYCNATRLPSEHEIDTAKNDPLLDPSTTFEIRGEHDDDQ